MFEIIINPKNKDEFILVESCNLINGFTYFDYLNIKHNQNRIIPNEIKINYISNGFGRIVKEKNKINGTTYEYIIHSNINKKNETKD